MIDVPVGSDSKIYAYLYGASIPIVTAEVIQEAFDGLLASAQPFPSHTNFTHIRYSYKNKLGMECLQERTTKPESISSQDKMKIREGFKRLKEIAANGSESQKMAVKAFNFSDFETEKEFFHTLIDPVTKEKLVVLWGIFVKPLGRLAYPLIYL